MISDRVGVGDGHRLAFIGGPCVIETREATLDLAARIRDVCEGLNMPFIFKASFDKANRTSIHSYRGCSIEEGVSILADVREKIGVPVLTDIHESHQASIAAQVVDVLQIPAFLCRQTDLLLAAAATGRAVNVKKGQFLSPGDMAHVVEKLRAGGARNILLTERGTMFGYNALVVDFRSLSILRELGQPVVFDATHSVQAPGAAGGRSGGERRHVPALARAAAAIGVDAVFMEVHPAPDGAPSDGPNMVPLGSLPSLLGQVLTIDAARRESAGERATA